MLKKIFAAVAVACVSVCIASCSGQSNTKFKVALLVTGSKADHGWNQLAADSLAAAAKDSAIETVVLEKVSKDKAADQIRQCDAQGVNLVILHGYEYLDAAKDLSDPTKSTAVKVKIAVSGGD